MIARGRQQGLGGPTDGAVIGGEILGGYNGATGKTRMEPEVHSSNRSESAEHSQRSQLCIRQADDYLTRRKRRKASRKGWEAAAESVRAIAIQRGWNHNSRSLLVDVAQQVSDEQGSPDIVLRFGPAIVLYSNSYDNSLPADVIEIYLGIIKSLLPELERIRCEAPPPFTPETGDQHDRWRRLTREVG